jgi:hypothetical protein
MCDKQLCLKVLSVQTYSIQVLGLEFSSRRQERVPEGVLILPCGLPAVNSME